MTFKDLNKSSDQMGQEQQEDGILDFTLKVNGRFSIAFQNN
jgi:hypothetical protein